MPVLPLPADVEEVFREFRVCEFTTLAKDGTPITWPTIPFYESDTGRFIVTTSVAFPQKAFNVRRDPRVSLLWHSHGMRDTLRIAISPRAASPAPPFPGPTSSP